MYITSCDSGSNKVFDFKGSGELVGGVKEIILSIWDKVITHRKDEFVSRLDAVKTTLPMIEYISKMEREGSISPQDAHLMSKKLVASAVNFMETGSLIPDLQQEAYFDPEKLLSVQETLLLSAPEKPPIEDLASPSSPRKTSSTKRPKAARKPRPKQ